MTEKILNAIKELKEKSKKRNFTQTFDLIVILKEFDTKKPENKFVEDIVLPHGRGEDAKVVVFSDAIKDVDCKVLTGDDINRLSKVRRDVKKLISETDFFLAEPKLMPLIGKIFGQFLAPKGKMPKLLTGDVNSLIEDYKKSVRIRIKDSPVIQCSIGKEDMDDEKVVGNIVKVIKFLESKLPKGRHNFGKVLLKLTMCKPVEIEV